MLLIISKLFKLIGIKGGYLCKSCVEAIRQLVRREAFQYSVIFECCIWFTNYSCVFNSSELELRPKLHLLHTRAILVSPGTEICQFGFIFIQFLEIGDIYLQNWLCQKWKFVLFCVALYLLCTIQFWNCFSCIYQSKSRKTSNNNLKEMN